MKEKSFILHAAIWLTGLALAVVIAACANIGTPNGGPYDELPPKFVSSTPIPNATNYKGRKIEIIFDELIQIDKPSENVIITPPQMEMPIVRANGKKINIELKDTLKPNTSYTIDFTNSVSDNNEKNVLENYSFAFSTGDSIDTLQISGTLLNAENLEPMSGVLIGLHSNLNDTAFVKTPFDRTSKTNDRGHFTIRNIRAGTYRIYALKDANNNYMYDQPSEEVAWSDSLIVPSFYADTRQDTIWKDTVTIDSVRTVGFTHYTPDNIALRLFKSKFVKQYMLRSDRGENRFFTLRFNAPVNSELPKLHPLNFAPADSNWYFLQKTEGNTSLVYWLRDSSLIRQDTLSFAVDYLKTDSLNHLQLQTDTMQMLTKKIGRAAAQKKEANKVKNKKPPKKQKPEKNKGSMKPDGEAPKDKSKNKKTKDEVQTDFLGMSINPSGTLETFDSLRITFTEPVINLDSSVFKLKIMKDSTWQAVPFRFFQDSTNTLSYIILRPWKYEEEYQLTVDSLSITSLYGRQCTRFEGSLKVKTKDEYGNLYINIAGVDTFAYAELLNSSDAVVRKVPVKNGGALFMDIKPDKYYVRMVIDLNNNGIWDTGDYAAKRQPEEVFYMPKMFEVKQNWDLEEETPWDFRKVEFTKQKPMAITKNKPAEVTKKKRNYKDEGKATKSSSSTFGKGNTNFGSGLSL